MSKSMRNVATRVRGLHLALVLLTVAALNLGALFLSHASAHAAATSLTSPEARPPTSAR